MAAIKLQGWYDFYNHPLVWLWNGVYKPWSCLCLGGASLHLPAQSFWWQSPLGKWLPLGRNVEPLVSPSFSSLHVGLCRHPPPRPLLTIPGPCLATVGICGKTSLSVLIFRVAEVFFPHKVTVENKEKTENPRPRGAEGSARMLGFAMMWKHMASECNMNSPEISPGWNLCFQLCRNTYDEPLKKSVGGCVKWKSR